MPVEPKQPVDDLPVNDCGGLAWLAVGVGNLGRRRSIHSESVMEVVQLTQREFDALGEYSCSLPTGTIVGKRWKRDTHAFNPHHVGKPPNWWLGEFYDLGPPDNEKSIGIHWSKIEIKPSCPKHPKAEVLKQGRKGPDHGKWFCPLCGDILSP